MIGKDHHLRWVRRNYKVHDQDDLHYLTYAPVGWVDAFTGMLKLETLWGEEVTAHIVNTNDADHGSQIRGSGGLDSSFFRRGRLRKGWSCSSGSHSAALTLPDNPMHMDLAARKWNIMEHLSMISDDGLLEQIEKFIKTKVADHDDISDEEYAEFEEAIAKHERGESTFHTEEESIRLIRAAGKGKA